MAELSASEVCLRGLGYLPPADYLIKPWEGRNDEDGFHARLVPKEMKEPGSKVYGQLLYQLCTIQRFQHPWFKTKVTTEESGKISCDFQTCRIFDDMRVNWSWLLLIVSNIVFASQSFRVY